MPIDLMDTFSFVQSPPDESPSGEIGDKSQVEVAILGAGLAGLTCAYRLVTGSKRPLSKEHLLVLEREAEPGGRIRSLKVEGSVINLGAVTFQPAHYSRLMQLLDELGLEGRIKPISRRRMTYGYDDLATRADNVSLAVNAFKGIFGQGIFSPSETLQLIRFLRYTRYITAPEQEAEFMALHEISVVEWARRFGFADEMQHKFVEPFVRYCFRSPQEVSAAFGIFLLGFNFSQPAALEGGLGQIAEALAARLGGMLRTEATVLSVARCPSGFEIIYKHGGRLRALTSRLLVVTLPANVAGHLVPEMRARAKEVVYGAGSAVIAVGRLKHETELQIRVSNTTNEAIIYGGEVQATPDKGHIANVLAYKGAVSDELLASLFEGGRVETVLKYDISPAAAAPGPGQTPLPIDWGEGLYMAGDCTGLFPSQETAVSSGELAAELMLSAINHG